MHKLRFLINLISRDDIIKTVQYLFGCNSDMYQYFP